MRKDLIIGLSISVLVHWSFLFLTKAPAAPKKHEVEAADVVKIEMPTLPPEEPEKKQNEEPQDEDAVVSTIAPPSLVEIPNVVPNATFVMVPEPPPPPGIATAKGVVTIPANPRPPGWGRGYANLFNLDQLDQIPVATYKAVPVYPYEMKRNGTEGTVTVGFICDTEGNVRDAYVVNSTNRGFDAPAVQAVSKWKFKAGKRGGKVVNTRMSVPILFNISSDN
jgi:periplasmic protein TonB